MIGKGAECNEATDIHLRKTREEWAESSRSGGSPKPHIS